jgi:hypothetical protein
MKLFDIVLNAGLAKHGAGDHAGANVADGQAVGASRVEDVIGRLAAAAAVHVFMHDGGIARNVLV